MKEVRYSYEQSDEFRKKLMSVCDKYYTRLWHGFLNYYNYDTDERIGYEAIMDGYYFIDNDAV